MKNYTYSWMIENQGYVEVDESKYTEHQLEMKKFVESMSPIIASAKCGWDDVKYKVVEHTDRKDTKEYMVLYCGGYGTRWIPIDGNSKGCNFSVLGENLW